MRNSMLSGSSMGRKDSVCGQMGVMRMAGISGWTREPPAESCRAVSQSQFTMRKHLQETFRLTE
jgi:hypothetical protein